MSRIGALTARLCPSGVKFETLGVMGSFIRGNGLQKKDFVVSGVGCIHYGQIHTHYRTWARETLTFVSPVLAKQLRHARTGDVVIATTSEDDDAVAKAVAWLGAEDVAVSNDAYIYRHSLDPKYVAYFFQSEQFQVQKRPFITGTKVRRISGENLAKIRIPVPPLEVQREIALTLDGFAELEAKLSAELEAELEARRRQQQHYRGALLGLVGPDRSASQWKLLGDLAINHDSRRRPVTKAARFHGDIPYYGASGIVDYVSDYIFDGDFLLVSEDGANLLARSSPIAFSVSGKSWVNNHAHVLEFNTYATRRFVELYLNAIDLSPFVSGASQPKLNQANLNKIPIPVPTQEEQSRIVGILDQFDALMSDLYLNLPAERKARRQQYECYRDRLLTFREA